MACLQTILEKVDRLEQDRISQDERLDHFLSLIDNLLEKKTKAADSSTHDENSEVENDSGVTKADVNFFKVGTFTILVAPKNIIDSGTVCRRR